MLHVGNVLFGLQCSPPYTTRNQHAKYKRRARPPRNNQHAKDKSRAKPPGSPCRAKYKKSGLACRKYKGRSKPQLAINIGETSSFSDVYGTAPTMSATRTTVTAPWRFRQSFPATFCKELSNATHVPSDTTAKPMAKPSSARPMSAKPDHCKRSPLPNMPRGVCTHSDQLEKKTINCNIVFADIA